MLFNKKLFPLVFLTFLTLKSFGQIKRGEGKFSGNGAIGISQFGLLYQIGGSYYLKKQMAINIDFNYELATIEGINLSSYYFQPSLDLKAFEINQRIFFNPGFGLNANYFSLDPIYNEIKGEEGWNYGLTGQMEVEAYLTNKLVLFTQGKYLQYLNKVFNEDSGIRGRSWFLKGGLKYIIN